jgi:hypothetical protein
MLRHFQVLAPEGRHKLAQGNALGTGDRRPRQVFQPALKGRNTVALGRTAVREFVVLRPYRAAKRGGFGTHANVPRASPWAILFGPVGAVEVQRNTITLARGSMSPRSIR